MESLRPQRQRRRPSLTPMIDVVFLLLVFFMLASRFGADMALPLPLASAGQEYSGPPRLIEITPDTVRLNGIVTALAEVPERLSRLTSAPTDAIILQGRNGADLQRVIDVTQVLSAAGFETVVLVE